MLISNLIHMNWKSLSLISMFCGCLYVWRSSPSQLCLLKNWKYDSSCGDLVGIDILQSLFYLSLKPLSHCLWCLRQVQCYFPRSISFTPCESAVSNHTLRKVCKPQVHHASRFGLKSTFRDVKVYTKESHCSFDINYFALEVLFLGYTF